MVERLVAVLGGVDGDAEVVLELGLSDELVEAPGAEGDVKGLFVVLELRGGDSLSRRAGTPCRSFRGRTVLLAVIIRSGATRVYARVAWPGPDARSS
jgi:hypothetical protein